MLVRFKLEILLFLDLKLTNVYTTEARLIVKSVQSSLSLCSILENTNAFTVAKNRTSMSNFSMSNLKSF